MISASKQKRLAEKVSSIPFSSNAFLHELNASFFSVTQAAKLAAKGGSAASSKAVSKAGTPLTNVSAANSQEDLTMAKLRLDTDRSGNGVLTSDAQARDIHIDSYSLSFHGRLLIENAEISLNYGQRFVLIPTTLRDLSLTFCTL